MLSQSIMCYAEVMGVSAASMRHITLGMREAPRMGGLKRCACVVVAEIGLLEIQVQRQSAVLISRSNASIFR